MGRRLTPPRLQNLDLNAINQALIEVYRNLNAISNSADEVSFRESKTGAKELIIVDDGREYKDSSSKNLTVENLEVKELCNIRGTIRGGTVGSLTDRVVKFEDDTYFYVDNKNAMRFQLSANTLHIGTKVTNLDMLSDVASEHSYFTIAPKTANFDAAIRFVSVGEYKWTIGNDASDSHKFCFQSEASSISDVSEVEISAGGDLSIAGNITVGGNIIKASDGGSTITLDTSDNVAIAGDLEVNGGDATIKNVSLADADLHLIANASAANGNDWTIRNTTVSQTLTIVNDKSGSPVTQLQILPHATVASGTSTFYTQLKVNTETAAGSATNKIAVLDSGVIKYRTAAQIQAEVGADTVFMTHNFDMTGSGAQYIPFGGSQTESAFVTDSTDDETRFIAPFDGALVKIMFQSASDPTSGALILRVNGTDGTESSPQTINGANTTHTLTPHADAKTFSAGDRLRVKFNPGAVPDEVAMTSVWTFVKT